MNKYFTFGWKCYVRVLKSFKNGNFGVKNKLKIHASKINVGSNHYPGTILGVSSTLRVGCKSNVNYGYCPNLHSI